MDAMRTRLAEVLAAYGADPARWPAAERDRLMAHMDNAPDLQALLSEAREIDQVLGRAGTTEVPAGAATRLLARAGQQNPSTTVIPLDRARARPGPSVWSWGAAAALAAVSRTWLWQDTTVRFGPRRPGLAVGIPRPSGRGGCQTDVMPAPGSVAICQV